jgi:tetratricopeptide (TPR) repeat protein
LNGCELRTSLAGFVSDPIRLGMRRYLENPDVGVMVLHSTNGTGGTGISLNTLRAPKKARKSYRKALKELAKAKANPSKATKELEKAVKVYPEYSAAWYLLGQLRLAAQDHSGGREAFERALAVEPNYVSPYLPLAALELGDRRWKEAAQLSRQVLELNPDAIGAHYSLGVASYFLRNLVTAEQSARKVLDSSEARKYPRMHYLLGIILATKGDFPSAAVQIRRYLKISPNAPEAEPMKKELRKWEAEGRIKSVTATDAG